MSLFLNGCLPKPACITEPGTLHLKLSVTDGQLHSQALAGNIRRIQVKLDHKDDKVTKETIVAFTGDDQELAISNLYPGDWQVTVSALDADDSIIFQGTVTTFIKPAETTALQISLLPAPGFLEVSCDVSGINGLAAGINGTLYVYLNPEEGKTKYYSLIRDGALVKAMVSLPEGTFEVKVAVPNVSSALFISSYYTVTIQAGKTTALNIKANGNLAITGTINSTPATPTNLTAFYDELTSTVSLTWSHVNESDLAGYRIYRSNPEGRMVRIATVDKNTSNYSDRVNAADFFHNGLKYAVSSYDSGGIESFWSESVYIRK